MFHCGGRRMRWVICRCELSVDTSTVTYVAMWHRTDSYANCTVHSYILGPRHQRLSSEPRQSLRSCVRSRPKVGHSDSYGRRQGDGRRDPTTWSDGSRHSISFIQGVGTLD